MPGATSALDYALAYVGTKESPRDSNRGPQIDKWQRAVDMLAQPWCGAFVHACLEAGGVTGLSWRMRYCPYIVEDARAGRNGLARVVSWDEKRPGDLVVYQWDTGAVDHVGILKETLSADTIRVVEGNTAVGNDSNGGEVMVRDRSRRFVAAIVRPAYPAVPVSPCAFGGVVLRNGSTGSAVKSVQTWVNALRKAGYDYPSLTVDGEFGPKTEEAVRDYQSRHDLTVDGQVGAKTWVALCQSAKAVA